MHMHAYMNEQMHACTQHTKCMFSVRYRPSGAGGKRHTCLYVGDEGEGEGDGGGGRGTVDGGRGYIQCLIITSAVF